MRGEKQRLESEFDFTVGEGTAGVRRGTLPPGSSGRASVLQEVEYAFVVLSEVGQHLSRGHRRNETIPHFDRVESSWGVSELAGSFGKSLILIFTSEHVSGFQ